MRDLANLFAQLALMVGVLLIVSLVFDLSLGALLAGGAAGLSIPVTHYVRARRANRATVQTVLDEIIHAIADVRAVAEAEGDESRKYTAGYLEGLFVDVPDRYSLRRAAGRALGVYHGGSGSFADIGGPEQYRVVEQLRIALRRGRS